MIARVLVDGADVSLDDVFAAVTIRHGRGSADDAPLASTATVSLVDVTREVVSAFAAGQELRLLLAGDVPRFVGRITDAELRESVRPGEIETGTLSVVAVSRLAALSELQVGAVDYPAEAWSSRVVRVLTEASAYTTWNELAGTFAAIDPARTFEEPTEIPAVVLVAPDPDPELAARSASATTLGQMLAGLVETEPAAIATTPGGSVLVQALSGRRFLPSVELDAAAVAWAPDWTQTDDVENVVTVAWDGGEVTATDETSRDRFGDRVKTIRTELAELPAATRRAALRVDRRAVPAWLVQEAELLGLDATIGVGSPVIVPSLPAWAPADTYLGLVEGWTDHVEGDEWTMTVTLSDPALSGFGLLWSNAPAIAFQDVDPAITWRDANRLLTT